MVLHTVREVDNQFRNNRFRTSQIAASGVGKYISGNGGTYTFHASGFVNNASIHEVIIVGNGLDPTNYNVEFFMTSSLISSERQYYYQDINLRAIDGASYPFPLHDINETEHLHGKITNDATSGMWIDYIELRYNDMLQV